MKPDQYWKANAELKHITPPGELFPESDLFPVLQSVCVGRVFEFGCGYGRLSKAFAPDSYVGYDINPAAIKAARLGNPEHHYSFEVLPGDTFLAHTVMLHVPDDAIGAYMELAKTYKRVVIGEIMGRKWRRNGLPPVFNREPEEYEAMMGMKAMRTYVPYPRYSTNLTMLVFDGA